MFVCLYVCPSICLFKSKQINLVCFNIKFASFANYTLEGRKEMFYLTTHSTHYIDDYMASDIW